VFRLFKGGQSTLCRLSLYRTQFVGCTGAGTETQPAYSHLFCRDASRLLCPPSQSISLIFLSHAPLSSSRAQLYSDASIYMPLRISIWDDRGPNFEDSLIAEVTFEAIEIYQSVGHIKSETLPNGAVYVIRYRVMQRSTVRISS
jgi:hypothetical protein